MNAAQLTVIITRIIMEITRGTSALGSDIGSDKCGYAPLSEDTFGCTTHRALKLAPRVGRRASHMGIAHRRIPRGRIAHRYVPMESLHASVILLLGK